jgi:hypothetical protein
VAEAGTAAVKTGFSSKDWVAEEVSVTKGIALLTVREMEAVALV